MNVLGHACTNRPEKFRTVSQITGKIALQDKYDFKNPLGTEEDVAGPSKMSRATFNEICDFIFTSFHLSHK